MSADAGTVTTTTRERTLDPRSIRVLRYAAGSALAMAVAMGINWQLSFLLPVLSLNFLASPAPRPSFRAGLVFVSIIAVSCLAGLMLGKYLISYPLVYVPFTALILLRLFYFKATGRLPLLVTWLLITLLVIPMIVMISPEIAGMAAAGILLGAVATICLIWLAHGLLPDPEAGARNTGSPAPAAATAPPPPSKRFRTAAVSTLVVLPLFVYFYSFHMIQSMLILIFVALLSSQPGFASNFKTGGALIIGNAIGGAVAIVFYQLLVWVPEFYFLVLLTFLAGLVFGERVFSDKPTAKLYGMAYSTLLLVIGSVTAGGSGEAGAKVYTRVIQITIAVTWVVMASGVADRYLTRKGL